MRARSAHRKTPGPCAAVAKASASARAMADKSADKPEGKAEGKEGKHYVPPEIGFRAVNEDAGGRMRPEGGRGGDSPMGLVTAAPTPSICAHHVKEPSPKAWRGQGT